MSQNMDANSEIELVACETHQNCRYCLSKEGSVESWLQSTHIEPEKYQILLDHGWRRIGLFMCKSTVDKACCCQYAIRSDALKYQLSKSHKRVLKRMANYLMTEGNENSEKRETGDKNCSNQGQKDEKNGESIKALAEIMTKQLNISAAPQNASNSLIDPHLKVDSENASKVKTTTRQSAGPDPTKPLCMKSKLRRRPNNVQKFHRELKSSPSPYEVLRSLIPHKNPSEAFKRCLRVVQINANEHDPKFQSTSIESFELFKKFQSAVLGEADSEWSFSKWVRYFVNSPISPGVASTKAECGNFHQQYILDGKLIAVGVITLTPEALVTGYCYYDPDFRFLSLGIYTAINEICFIKELHQGDNRKRYYYMGTYTHSCEKMRYKLQYKPIELLCPDTYKWILLDDCLQYLEIERPRLNPSNEEIEVNENKKNDVSFDASLNNLLVSYRSETMAYRDYAQKRYCSINVNGEKHDHEMTIGINGKEIGMMKELDILKKYMTVAGRKCVAVLPMKVPLSVNPE